MNIRVVLFVAGFFAVLAIVPYCFADQMDTQAPDTAVTGGIWNGQAIEKPLPKPRKQQVFKVKHSFTHTLSGRSVTIQEVEPPLVAIKPTELARSTILAIKPTTTDNSSYIPAEFIVVSLTVYGRGEDKLTRLTVWNRNRQITCWSNINGHFLTGFDQFKANGRPYWMISTAKDATSPNHAKEAGCPVHRFRRGGATTRYIMEEGQQPDAGLQKIVADLHKLYRVEKERLAVAHTARKRNMLLRAGLPEPPPEPPKPVTIRFWKRDMSKENKQHKQGGAK